MNERIRHEMQHLITPPSPDEKPLGLGTVRFVTWCIGNAESVLEKAKAILILVDQQVDHWPDENQWNKLLPDWFVKKCGHEMSDEEVEQELARLSSLSPREQLEWEKKIAWPLSNWLYYVEPDNRHWFWWDGKILDPDILVVAVEVDHWPFPWGSLDWLLRAAGAERVEAEQ